MRTVVLALSVLAATAGGASALSVDRASGRDQILFEGGSGRSDIYAVDAGRRLLRLTRSLARDYEPRWSPNGKRVVFSSYRDENHEVYVMNPDGTGQRNLTRSPDSWDSNPVWSSAGDVIAFVKKDSWDDDATIWLINKFGGEQRKLTDGWNPVWSPSGRAIAFTRGVEPNEVIFILDLKSGRARRLTRGSYPTWSPAGDVLGFERHVFLEDDLINDPSGADIYVIGIAGKAPRRLIRDGWKPIWSPDGKHLLFERNDDLWVANPSSGSARQLVTGFDGAWSRDGQRIAYANYQSGFYSLAVTTIDAGTPRTLVRFRERVEPLVGPSVENLSWRP